MQVVSISIVFIFSLFLFSNANAQLTLKHLGVSEEKISEFVTAKKGESDYEAVRSHCSKYIENSTNAELLYKNDTIFVYAINAVRSNIPDMHIYWSKFGNKYQF